jgi:hypothetical protein
MTDPTAAFTADPPQDQHAFQMNHLLKNKISFKRPAHPRLSGFKDHNNRDTDARTITLKILNNTIGMFN